LFLSSGPGNVACAYVEVQIVRRRTRRRDWKLKSAVCWVLVGYVRGERGEGRLTMMRE
jgi:hypothetical protein